MRSLLTLLLAAFITAVIFGAIVMIFENSLIYFPERYPAGDWSTRELITRGNGIISEIEEIYFPTSDGLLLHGWMCRCRAQQQEIATPASSNMTLLWFHGNAGNITHRSEMILALMKIPVNIFIIDYRGYGRSEGTPSEHGLYLDARAAWEHLTVKERVPSNRIVIFGKSLGGAAAIDLATEVEPAGLIVQSSFTSAREMARIIMPIIPHFLIRTKMDSTGKIGRVNCPKLFIHSRDDEIIPFEHGKHLYELAQEPKKHYWINGASHNDTWLVGGEEYISQLRKFIIIN